MSKQLNRAFGPFSVARAALVLGFAFAASSCTISAAPAPVVTGGVAVYEAPPPAPVYVQPVAPYAGAVWVEGHWTWVGNRWVWANGYYVQSRPGYIYVQPRWERRGGGWVYFDGTWRAHSGPVYVQPRRGPVYVQPPPRNRVYVEPPRNTPPRVRPR